MRFQRLSFWASFGILCSLSFWGCQSEPVDPAFQVNPFIGTGGHGHTYPGATMPFGMVQLSPDSRLEGWDGCGGYHYSDSVIYGFSHTHLQGTGVSDYGDILFAPCTQFNSEAKKWSERYASRFSHSNESAHAGYYQVFLDDQGIDVELTATERVGIHRYRLEKPDTLTLMIDMQHRDKLVHYSIYPLNDSTLVGHRVSDNWAREQHVYFAARFDQPFKWQDQQAEVSEPIQNHRGEWEQDMEYVPVFACDFGVLSELNAEVALSFVSIEGALANLNEEAVLPDFEAYQNQAEKAWNVQLNRIEVEGGSTEERETFYTALYHCFTTPNIANDVTGVYRGTDLQVHQLDSSEGAHYTVFSLWDTFRALHPLLNWLEPERSRDFVRTMLRMYRQGGQLPVWELAANYTGCMIGYHSVPVIDDAVSWGIDAFDHGLALEAMVQAADSGHLGLPAYASLGYIPLDEEHESVSKTLEYAFDDACIARFARRIPNPDTSIIKRFEQRALHYRNLFNKNSGFFQPKRAAAWLEDFEPREVNFNYTEANGWQYNFFVPHDVGGHIKLLGGPQAYEAKLDEMFTTTSETTGRNQADITGLIGQYAHGNEPSHHMAYLFPFVGKHHRTAELVSQIRSELYSNQPDGLSGNEDCGQMSAWYVWSALGLYPVCPGSDDLIAGTPMFTSLTIHPNSTGPSFGAPMTIKRSGTGVYVSGLSLDSSNMHEDQKAFVKKSDLLKGGSLEFQMAATPCEFGAAEVNWPLEMWNDAGFIPVPVIHAPRTFRNSCEAALSVAWNDAIKIEYRVLFESDDSDLEWIEYLDPIELSKGAVIEARGRNAAGETSSIVSHRIVQVNHGYTMKLSTPFSPQYAAGGEQALIDGIAVYPDEETGWVPTMQGDWQGYWGEDVIGTVDLGDVTSISGFTIGALRDIRPWIFLPRSVEVYSSLDGESWSYYGKVGHDQSNADESPLRHEFSIRNTAKARYLRFEVENFGALPPDHLGAGNPSWIFLDEIRIATANP